MICKPGFPLVAALLAMPLLAAFPTASNAATSCLRKGAVAIAGEAPVTATITVTNTCDHPIEVFFCDHDRGRLESACISYATMAAAATRSFSRRIDAVPTRKDIYLTACPAGDATSTCAQTIDRDFQKAHGDPASLGNSIALIDGSGHPIEH
jgi:hypothetical protein